MKETKQTKDKPLSEKGESNTDVGGPELGNVYWAKDVVEAVKKLKEQTCKEDHSKIDSIFGTFNHSPQGELSAKEGRLPEDTSNSKGCGKTHYVNGEIAICLYPKDLCPKCQEKEQEDEI